MSTLEEIIACTKDWLTPEDIAPHYGCNPQSIRIQARENPAAFGFLVSVCGNRTRISRRSYIRACGVEI